MDLDILFLGKLFPREKEAEIKAKMKSGMQDAANALQYHIIDGLDANFCGTIRILDYLPVGSYPKSYADAHIAPYAFRHCGRYDAGDLVVGCTNMTILKQFANRRPFCRQLRKWVQSDSGRPKVLLLYTPTRLFLSLAKYAKRLNPHILTCCIIADIPEFITGRTLHGAAKVFNDYEVRKTNALYPFIDRFVLLTEQMAPKLGITVPYLVMEGIAPDITAAPAAAPIPAGDYILYTGTLNYEFGIEVLLQAFAQIQNPDWKLVICGFGQAEKTIRESSDPRIVYLGRVDRTQALALQRRAMLLVNPRQNNAEFTKYSFPSKTMEYLASGVPVVAYKLDGIPDEYDGYLNYVPENTPEALAAVITAIGSKSAEERRTMGRRAQAFVTEEKNAKRQAGRILRFLEEGL